MVSPDDSSLIWTPMVSSFKDALSNIKLWAVAGCEEATSEN